MVDDTSEFLRDESPATARFFFRAFRSYQLRISGLYWIARTAAFEKTIFRYLLPSLECRCRSLPPGADLADPGDRKQPLDIGVRHQVRVEALLESADVLPEKLPLLAVAGGLELGHGRQVRDTANVVLLGEPVNAVSSPDLFLDQAEPGPHHVAERSELSGDHVGLQQVPDPVPAAGGFDCGSVRRELREVAGDGRPTGSELRFGHDFAVGVHRGQNAGALMQIDPRVQHGAPLDAWARRVANLGMLAEIILRLRSL